MPRKSYTLGLKKYYQKLSHWFYSLINNFDSNSKFDFPLPIPPVSVLNQENEEVVKVSSKKKRGRPSKPQDPNVPRPKKKNELNNWKQNLEKVLFTIGNVSDDLRDSILIGRISYKNEIVANSGRRNEITTIYQNIIVGINTLLLTNHVSTPWILETLLYERIDTYSAAIVAVKSLTAHQKKTKKFQNNNHIWYRSCSFSQMVLKRFCRYK